MDLIGFPLSAALKRLEEDGYEHICLSEIRSRKGVPDADDLRVLCVLSGSGSPSGCLIRFGRFKTRVEHIAD